MKISYNWLSEYVAGKLPKPEKVTELLIAHAFEVEAITKVGKDTVFDVAVLPNRAHDCLSHVGVAREVAALTRLKVKSIQSKVKENKKLRVADYLKVEVKEKGPCPLYASRVIFGVKVGASPAWLRIRLEALGQKSINNIVDATNYVMLALGQPLHVFDLDKIEGGKIIVRRAAGKEVVETLGGGACTLAKDDLVIADTKGALAIAGIKGGTKAEVTADTKNIALESAYFAPTGIRKTSKRLGLRTDASLRFENGTVPGLPPVALDAVTELIVRVAGGEVAMGKAIAGRVDTRVQRVMFAVDGVNKLLGTNLSEKEMLAMLKRLGFSVRKTARGYEAIVPEWRLDVEHQADIAEEVGRMYGFEHIVSVAPTSMLMPPEENDAYALQRKARAILVSCGMTETYNRSFVGDRQVKLFDVKRDGVASIANPLSEEQKYLRPSLVFPLLENVVHNAKHYKEIRLFEVGTVFWLVSGKVLEETMVSGIISLTDATGTKKGAEFYEAKGVVDMLFDKLGIDGVSYAEHEGGFYETKKFWHSDRAAELRHGDKKFGFVAELEPAFCAELGISQRVAFFEILASKLVELTEEKTAYRPISKFPAVERDIAVLVPSDAKVDDVQGEIERAGGELLFDSDLFDIYEGEHLEAEQKSLAFHLIFQSSQRTLTDKEVNMLFGKIVLALETQDWEVRK